MFVLGVPMMVITLAVVSLIPELPLRRGVREDVAQAEVREALAA